jgi:L-threonylcarbamoyladenylate synthase
MNSMKTAVIGTDTGEAKKWLEAGQVIGIPTETVYGLAGNALSPAAVARIFEVKNRPTFDPLIVHSSRVEKIAQFVAEMPPAARRLADAFWPGPLTLLLKKADRVPDLVTSGLDTVAVRIPNHPLTLRLLDALDFPLAAPSANPFGYVSPTRAAHVQAQLGDKIPYILDGGPCQVGIESTIVGFEGTELVVYRLGGIPVEAIEELMGPVRVTAHSSSNPKAPGMLISHYAPLKPVFTAGLDGLVDRYGAASVGVLAFQHASPRVPAGNQFVLSESGSPTEAAQRLFAGLRSLDGLPVAAIYAELLPERELGRAINDRIRRAAAR